MAGPRPAAVARNFGTPAPRPAKKRSADPQPRRSALHWPRARFYAGDDLRGRRCGPGRRRPPMASTPWRRGRYPLAFLVAFYPGRRTGPRSSRCGYHRGLPHGRRLPGKAIHRGVGCRREEIFRLQIPANPVNSQDGRSRSLAAAPDFRRHRARSAALFSEDHCSHNPPGGWFCVV